MSGLRGRFRLRLGAFELDAEFDAPGRGVTAVFGPSGSGKTTLLRCVAGLERARDGFLEVDGDVWQDDARGIFLPTHRRPLGYVFQEPSLFPHLTVRRNLRYGWRRIPPDRRQVSYDQAVELLGLGGLLQRDPETLSGGERQRAAIARALLTSPRLLLMDEPLASLDRASKADILPYLGKLHDELSIPILYVSHAPDEVAQFADTLIVLDQGRVRAAGPLAELITRLDLPLARRDDAMAMVEAVVAGYDEADHLMHLDFAGGRISVPHEQLPPGRRVRVRIHAQDVSLTLARQDGTSILNILPARVTELADDGAAQVIVRLETGGVKLLARVTRRSCRTLGLTPGMDLFAQVKGVALHGV